MKDVKMVVMGASAAAKVAPIFEADATDHWSDCKLKELFDRSTGLLVVCYTRGKFFEGSGLRDRANTWETTTAKGLTELWLYMAQVHKNDLGTAKFYLVSKDGTARYICKLSVVDVATDCHLDAAILEMKGDVQTLMRKGLALCDKERFQEAYFYFTSAWNRNCPLGLMYMGLINLSKGQKELAFEQLSEAMKLGCIQASDHLKAMHKREISAAQCA